MDANDVKSLELFCKPVFLYIKNDLQAKGFILQRCLSYKIQAKKNKKENSGGILIFNYMDRDNKCLKSQVTTEFSCPFCLVKCGSHEGVKCHLTSLHNHLNYSFWLWKENELQIAASVKLDAFSRNGELIDDVETDQWLPFTFLGKGRKRSQRDDSDTMQRLNVHFSELDLGDVPRHDTENGLTHHVDDGDVMITSPTIAHSPEKTSCEILSTTQPERAKSPEKTSCEILPTTQPDRAKSPEKTSSEILQITQPERAESSKPRVSFTRTYERRRFKSKITQPEMAKSPEKTSCKTLQITQPEIATSSKPKAPLDSKGKNKSAERTECKSVSKSPEMTHSPEKPGCKTLQITQPEIATSSEPKAPLDSKGKKKSPRRTQSKSVKSLKERQCYHSHSSQPMSTDKVLSKWDSEDEAYDDSDDIDERARMARLKDVSEEDKYFMCLWNSFINKQRVLADGHIPWACENFTKLHQKELISSQTLGWKWRLFMVTLSKHGLVCGKIIHKCNTFLLEAQAEAAPPPPPPSTPAAPAPAPAQAAAAAEASSSASASASTSQATVTATSNNLRKLIEKYSNHGSASASTSQAIVMATSNNNLRK